MSVDPVSLAITIAANAAMSASRTIEGPRLKDTSASVADYGTPLNYLVGQRLVTCPCFFAKPIREERKKRKGKGGKQVNYTGYGTWASHIADMPIAGIGQVLLDNHLVYDALGSEEKTYPLGPGYDIEAHMRFYLGTEEQEPDPDMLAYIEARDGPGTCPAYRGQSYIYFENIPLEMFGNRFPTVTVLAHTTTRVLADPENPVVYTYNLGSAFPLLMEGQPGYPDAIALYPASLVIGPFSAPATIVAGAGGCYVDDNFVFNGVVYGAGGAATYGAGHLFYSLEAGETLTVQVRNRFDPLTQATGTIAALVTEDQWVNAGADTKARLSDLIDLVATRCGIDPADCDWSATDGIEFKGYNWTQGTGRQILEPLLDLFDVDVRPHDFSLEALPRGAASAGALTTGEMARRDGAPYRLADKASADLPRRIFLIYADATAAHNPNVAMPPGPDPSTAGAVREASIDMKTLALDPDHAQPLAERSLRRMRFGRTTADFSITRQRLAIEPADVWTPAFDDRAWTMRATKLELGADGVIAGEWERDDPAIAALSGSAGADGAGIPEDLPPDDLATIGYVMDLPLLVDAHEQSAPLAYLAAGPDEPGVWTGADFAQSETGDLDSYTLAWDGIAASDGSTIGTVAEALPDAVPWNLDTGSAITVTINVGELTSASLTELLENPALNLAAIRSGDGWELVQFMTATLTDEREYALSGFLRGVRGSEWAMGGHAPGDAFVLLEVPKRRTMGASEIGDTDWYVASPTGHEPDQDEAFSVAFTGASHKPYAPVNGTAEFSGEDLLFTATRRTRLGGATLDGQDVPLGESAESWSLDIVDNTTSPPTVKRTITGSSLPLTYTEAQQIADFGAALSSLSPAADVTGVLHQVAPPLSLRGYALEIEVEP